MLAKIARLFIPLAVVLTPLIFWTLTSNFFTPPKQLLILVLVLLLFFGYIIDIIRRHSLTLPRGPLVLPLLGINLSIILNLVFVAEGRPEAIVGKGGILLILPIMSLLILTLNSHFHLTQTITSALLGSSVFLAIHTLLQLTFLYSIGNIPSYMQTRSFTLTGSFLTTLTLIILGGIISISTFIHAPSRRRPLYLGITIITTIAAVAIISLMFPNSPLTPTLIPYRETWSIALDALKPIRSMLLGVGLANFSTHYSAIKPLSLNSSSLWNTLPQTGSSELLTLLTTTGLIGLFTFIALIVSGLKLVHHSNHPLYPAFLFLILVFIFTPATIPVYFLFFLIISLFNPDSTNSYNLSPRTSYLLGSILFLGLIVLTFPLLRLHIADYYLRRSQLAIIQNDSQGAYISQQTAIKWAPQLTLSHLAYAELNLNLASSLSQKNDLTEKDRATISTLIQQAIRESKTTIQLRPNSSLAWLSLAKIYRNLINVADGADKFALDYYARAVSLDPSNPTLRVEYGGLYYLLGNITENEADKTVFYARAQTEFQLAIQLRPSYANAYYNLAKVLEKQGDFQNSYRAMEKVITYLDPSNTDYSSALSELETLKAKLPPTSPLPSPSPTSAELSIPSPLPSPLPGGPVDLNETP